MPLSLTQFGFKSQDLKFKNLESLKVLNSKLNRGRLPFVISTQEKSSELLLNLKMSESKVSLFRSPILREDKRKKLEGSIKSLIFKTKD